MDWNTTDSESEITHSIDCLLFTFMVEMGARGKCESNAMTYDNDTDARPATMALFSKDYHFQSFMVDPVAASGICENMSLVTDNETTIKDAILSESKCDWYHDTKLADAEKICSYDRVPHENDTSLSYYDCFWYRFIAELGDRGDCNKNVKKHHRVTSQVNCNAYHFAMHSVLGGIISIAGIICNCITLHMFCRGIVKTSTTYQLQWLAAIDTIFLILYLIRHALYQTVDFFNPRGDNPDHLYWRVIYPFIYVYVWPFYATAYTSTIWLTVFIGINSYLAICKPLSHRFSHLEQNGKKYVVAVIIIAVLCNIPRFFVIYLEQYTENGLVYYKYIFTSMSKSKWYGSVYVNIMISTLSISVPTILLLILTTKMLVKLRKQQKKRRNMQPGHATSDNVNAILISILVTFIVCQFPRLVYMVAHRYMEYSCGSFLFYFGTIGFVFGAVNSAANPFLYFMINKQFRSAFVSHCGCG